MSAVRSAVQHVVPDDIRQHELSAKCWCRPAVKRWNVTHRREAASEAPSVRCVYVDGWSGIPMVEWEALERRQARQLAEDVAAVMLAASRG
jgi:hypothetical protein